MKQYTPYLAVVLFATLSLVYMIDYENEINALESEIENQENYIDSLIQCIDTLQWKNEIWDFNVEHETTHLLSAIMFVESGNNDSAHAIGEDAVGCLQIRKTMVDDVNRILKRQKKDLIFTYDDRWLRTKSINMFDIYCKHYGLNTAEEIARCWNGGPRGMDKEATVYYWNKVQDHLDS